MIFNSFSHPCTVIDVLSELWDRVFINKLLDVSIDVRYDVMIEALNTVTVVITLTDAEVTVLVVAVITREFAVPLSYGVVEMLVDVWDE